MLPTPRLACRLGSCAPVGRVQDRPKRELRPVRGRAPLALAHPPSRAHTMEVYVPSPARGGGVYSIISFQRGELPLSRLPARALVASGDRSAPTEAGAETGRWTRATGTQRPL